MQTQITVTVLPQEEKNQKLVEKKLFSELSKNQIKTQGHKVSFVFVKKSIDARRGQLKIHLKYNVYIDEEPKDAATSELAKWKKADGTATGGKIRTVVIIGSGPAGLFAALRLLQDGIKPVIIERGQETHQRKIDIAKISTQKLVNPDSNYCFGEGGAGTFSDGKLYTRSNKRGNINKSLQIFAHFGADSKILTDAHPHIGTEKLPGVINAMRDFIIQMGGEFYFNTRCVDFIIEEKKVRGAVCCNTTSGEQFEVRGEAVILATGHSANDIYELLAHKAPSSLEAKTFAMGVRVEHPRTLIDNIQFHGKTEGMAAAEYRLVTQVEERGVYSFCMCPGGFVVPSSTAPDQIVVNGMSASGRNSQWSNAAIVVETRPEDIPETFIKQAEEKGTPALAGLLFRTWLEQKTKEQGDGQKAPSQRLTDFLSHKDTAELPKSSYTPGLVTSRLDQWLPEHIEKRLEQGFFNFDKNMKGFISQDAILIASETRTSTPVRIVRDTESLESSALKGLYPCGEGSGYSGGIVSSAMDGEKVAQKIAEKLLQEK